MEQLIEIQKTIDLLRADIRVTREKIAAINQINFNTTMLLLRARKSLAAGDEAIDAVIDNEIEVPSLWISRRHQPA
jgi:hypothetical protein